MFKHISLSITVITLTAARSRLIQRIFLSAMKTFAAQLSAPLIFKMKTFCQAGRACVMNGWRAILVLLHSHGRSRLKKAVRTG